MKPLAIAVALALLTVASPALAQFEGVIESKISSVGGPGPVQGKGKTWVSGAGWRAEMEMGLPGTGKPMRTVMLGKTSAPDTFYTVNDVTRTYTVTSAKEMEGLAGRAGKKKYTVKRAGSDTIAGLPCEKAVVTEQPGTMETEVCVTSKLPVGDWLRSAHRSANGGGWMKALEDAGLKGYPLRIATTTTDEPSFRSMVEVTKVEKRAVPASMFEVPKGYTKTSAFGVMAQDPAQAKQLEEAQKRMQEAMKKMSPEQRKMMEQMMKKGPEQQ